MKASIATATIVAFSALAGAVWAQLPPAKSAAGEMKAVDKASPKLMTGKVTQVDAGTRSFTIAAKGKEHRFAAGKGVALPKVGDVVDVSYAGEPGGPMEAVRLNSSKSNAY